MRSGGSVRASSLMTMSETATSADAMRSRIWASVTASNPGRKISMAPANPAKGPSQRLGPATSPKTLMAAVRQGLGGLSQMAGIPGSIGGMIRMNAGGSYGCIGEVVRSVTCLTRSGELVTYPAEELRFEYRSTNIPDPVIVSATFELEPTDPVALRDRVKEIFSFKKSTHPWADSSPGGPCTNHSSPVAMNAPS